MNTYLLIASQIPLDSDQEDRVLRDDVQHHLRWDWKPDLEPLKKNQKKLENERPEIDPQHL